jgi:hypothetical protein
METYFGYLPDSRKTPPKASRRRLERGLDKETHHPTRAGPKLCLAMSTIA